MDGWVRLDTRGGVVSGTKSMAETYGSPIPMTPAMLEDKFVRVSEPTLGRRGAGNAWERLNEIDEVQDVRELVGVLYPRG